MEFLVPLTGGIAGRFLSRARRIAIGGKHILILAFFLTMTATLHAEDENDYAYRKTIEYYIDGNDEDGYSLRSETEISLHYISERGTEWNEFTIYESFYNEVSDIEGELRDDDLDDEAIAFSYVDVQDIFISSNKVYTLYFPNNIEVGDDLLYSYEKEYDNLAYFPIQYVNNFNYLAEFNLIINHPENMQVDFEFFMPLGDVKYDLKKPEPGLTELRFKDLKEVEGMHYYPFDWYHAAFISKFSVGGKQLNPTAIGDFVKWYLDLFNFEVQLGAEHAGVLDEEIKEATSDLDKVRIIYDYVRSNIRYIADESNINAIVPRPPNTVMERRYGDCKDKSFLAAALGKQYGVEILPTLIATTKRPRFNDTHVTLYNHVICAYDNQGEFIYFDPTYKYGEFGTLPDGDIGGSALILDSKAPQFVTVPDPNDEDLIDVTIEVDIDSLESAKANIVLRDKYHASALRARTELTGIDLENFLSNLLTGKFRKLSLDFFEYEKHDKESITFSAHADLSKLLISSTTKTYLPKIPFESIDSDLLDRGEDEYGIYFKYLHRTKLTLRINAPGFEVSGDPLKLGRHDVSWAEADLQKDGSNGVEVVFHYGRVAKDMEGTVREEYLDFCKKYLKSKKAMFIFARKD